MSDATTVTVKGDYFELYKLLKFENLAESGGQAKQMIEAGEVQVNGEPETRKRRKLVVGDVVECLGERVTLVAE